MKMQEHRSLSLSSSEVPPARTGEEDSLTHDGPTHDGGEGAAVSLSLSASLTLDLSGLCAREIAAAGWV